MDSTSQRRRLKSVYKLVPEPSRSTFHQAVHAQRNLGHKAVDVLQTTGDVNQYISLQAQYSYLIYAERFLDGKFTALEIGNMSQFISCVNALLSDRVSGLWNIREINSFTKLSVLSAKCTALGMMFKEVRSVQIVYQRMKARVITSTKSSLEIPRQTQSDPGFILSHHNLVALLYLLKHSMDAVIPSLFTRLNNFVTQLVRDATTESMRQYCANHPRDFLVLQRTHSIVLHTLYSVLGVQSTHATKKKQSEAIVFALLREHSIHPVYSSIALTCDVQTTQHFASIALSTSLKSFLHYLVTHQERFDEPGVYQLFRIILKLQEYVGELKKELNINISQKLVQDSTEWRKAESIVQLLNSEVFAVASKSAKHTSTAAPTDQIAHSTASTASNTSSPLSEVEQKAWRALVGTQGRRPSLRRQRHKGTVFVTLELDLSNL